MTSRLHTLASVGKVVRKLRGETGLRPFAAKAGVGYLTVFRLERGRDVQLSAWLKLASAYKL